MTYLKIGEKKKKESSARKQLTSDNEDNLEVLRIYQKEKSMVRFAEESHRKTDKSLKKEKNDAPRPEFRRRKASNQTLKKQNVNNLAFFSFLF